MNDSVSSLSNQTFLILWLQNLGHFPMCSLHKKTENSVSCVFVCNWLHTELISHTGRPPFHAYFFSYLILWIGMRLLNEKMATHPSTNRKLANLDLTWFKPSPWTYLPNPTFELLETWKLSFRESTLTHLFKGISRSRLLTASEYRGQKKLGHVTQFDLTWQVHGCWWTVL